MTGKCPNCGEHKEITQQGIMSGMCDDCYSKKYTCIVCGEMLTDAWNVYTVLGKGNGHRECLET
jgi:hypothetical protein